MKLHPDHRLHAELLKTLTTHSERERAALDCYQQLIEESADEGVKYLCGLILEDEGRHHHVITEMANRIDSWIQGVNIEPSTPRLSPHPDRALLDSTRQLIALERQDAKALRHLKRELRDTPPTSLLPLLVTLMLHDTAKHIEIVQFIHDYAA